MQNILVDCDQNPRIAGSRITVYDILAETEVGSTVAEIAEMFQLTPIQVQAALHYIEEHREEVLRDYQQIQERQARGHPPEVQAKLDAIHAKYAPLWAERRRAPTPGTADAGIAGGH